jgi:hypothetical protein
MNTTLPKIVGPEYLVPLVHRTIKTIRVDATRRPESLPPRLHIPGSAKLLWMEADVIAWLHGLRQPVEAAPRQTLPLRRATRVCSPSR